MKKILLAVILCVSIASSQNRWVKGYIGNWHNTQSNVQQLLAESTFTHLVQFACGVRDDGVTIFEDANLHDLTVQSLYTVPMCHAESVKVLLCIFHHYNDVRASMSPSLRAQYVHSLLQVIRTYGYDGIDYDYEDGFDETLRTNYGITMGLLRDSLNALTAVTGKPYTISIFTFAESQYWWYPSSVYLDKIDIATYEMSGAFGGWPVAHGYNIYNGGMTFPSTGAKVPSADSLYAKWLRQGVPASKLSIASSTGASTWNGGLMMRNLLNDPRFAAGNGARYAGDWWEDPGGVGPNVGVGDNTNWQNIIGQYAQYPTQHDTVAIAAYKTVDAPGNLSDKFVSFDDPWMWWQKWNYMKNVRNGGGIMMWLPINGKSGPGNWPLIRAIKIAMRGDPLPVPPTGTFTVTPDTLPAGGGNVTMTWTASNSDVTSIFPAIGNVAASGETTVNISSSITFTLSVSNITAQAVYPGHVGVVSSQGAGGFSVIDSFNRPSTPTLGDGWVTSHANGLGIVNDYYANGQVCVPYNCGRAYGPVGRGFARRTEVFANDQYAEITPTATMPGGRYVYVGVRMSGTNAQGYYAKTDGRDTWLVKIFGGTETVLQTLLGIGFTEYGADRLYIQVIGSKLKIFRNDFQVNLDYTDTQITSGSPGIGVSPDNGSSIDTFLGGDFGGVAAPILSVSTDIAPFVSTVPNASPAQSYGVSGVRLVSNVTITASTNFQVSLSSNTGWANQIVLSPTSGTLASTTIYVRMLLVTAGTVSGNITTAATGVVTNSFEVSGTAWPALRKALYIRGAPRQ